MKTLYLTRHAKSSWANLDMQDIDRPLNERGERDAPFMGKMLNDKGIKPDVLISSPALRAKTTAEYFAKALQYPKKEILTEENIYEAMVADLLEIAQNLDDKWKSVMLFGHNPGFTYFANLYAPPYIENVPTCGIVAIEFQIDKWSDLNSKNGKIAFFDYPKKF